MANASFNSGFFNPSTDQVTFYIYWTGITASQLTQFTNSDLSVVDAMGSAITGASAEVGSGDGNTFPITVSGLPSNSSGQLQVKVAAGAITGSLAVASPLISWSTRSRASFTIGGSDGTNIYTTSTGNTKATAPFDVNQVYVEITSTVSLTDFSASDVIVSGGCVGSTTGSGTNYRLFIGLTDGTAGRVNIVIPEDSVSVGNSVRNFSFNFDRREASETGTPSTVTFGTNTYQTSTGAAISRKTNNKITDGSFWVPISFNPAVRGFTAQDIFVSGGCRGSLYPASSTGTSWRLRIDNQAGFNGIVTVGIFSDATSQSGGNHANSTQFAVDTTGGRTTTTMPAEFSILNAYDSSQNLVSKGTTLEDAEYTIDIQSAGGRAVSDFDANDIVVFGACIGSLTQLAGAPANTRWRLQVGIPADESGYFTIFIPANIVSVGNEPAYESFDYDRKTDSIPAAAPTLGDPYTTATGGNRITDAVIDEDDFYVPISFNSQVENFSADDIAVINACRGQLTPSTTTGRNWRLHIDNEQDFEGIVTVVIPSDITSQSGGNEAANRSYSVNTRDATSGTGNPTTFRILNAYSESTAGRNLTPRTDSILTEETVYVEIQSTRVVNDFSASDINISNGCIGARNTLTTGTLWRIAVGLEAGNVGVMTVMIPPNVVSIGNANARKDFRFDRADIESPPVGCSIGTPRSAATAGTVISEPISQASFYVPITFTSVVEGFTKNDVAVSGACKGELTVITTNQAWRIHIDPELGFKGFVTVTVPSNVTSQEGGNIAATRNFRIDQSEIIGSWRYAYFCPTDMKVHAAIRFTQDITGLSTTTNSTSNGDIFVKSANRVDALMDWMYAFSGNSGSTLSKTTDLRLVITPPDGTDTTIYLEFLVNSISYNNGQSLGPPSTIASEAIYVNNEEATAITPAQPTLADASANSDGTGTVATNPDGQITATSFFIRINFGRRVTNFDIDDIIVTNACKGDDLVPASTHNGQIWALNIDAHDEFEGTVTVAIAANVVSSEGGNLPVNRNYDVNTRADAIPQTSVTLHTPRTSIQGTTAITGNITVGTFYVPITFGGTAAISGFTIEDVIVTNGGRRNLQPKSSMVLTGSTFQTGRSFMLTVDTISGEDVPISITIPENVIRNPGGNPLASRTYNVDTTTASVDPVSVTLYTPRTSLQGTTVITGDITTGSFYVPIVFGGTKTITGFTADDITVINAGRGNLQPKSSMALTGSQFPTGRSFVLKVDTISGEETVVTVSVPLNASSQEGGNVAASRNYNVNTRGMDVDAAVVTIHAARSNRSGTSIINGAATTGFFYVPITFSGTTAITGFDLSDIIVINGCRAALTRKGSGVLTGNQFPTGRSFLLQIDTVANEEAVITVSVPANVTTQSGGNLPASRNFDVNTTQTPVSVTIHTARSNSDGTGAITGDIEVGTFYVPIVFGGTVTVNGFEASYITVTNGGRGALNSFSRSGFPSGRSFLLTVTTISGEENTVTVSIPPNASNLSSGSLAASRNFSVDTARDPVEPATVTLGDPYTAGRGGSRITSTITTTDFYVPITFNKVVLGFDKNDVAVASGCKGDLTTLTTNRIWRIHIDNYDQFKGIVTVTIPANVVSGPGNYPATRQYAVNTRTQIIPTSYVIQSPRSSQDGTQGANEPIRTPRWWVYITSDRASSNLAADDILITNATRARTVHIIENNRRWSIQITNPTDFDGIVSVAIPGGVNTRSDGNHATSRNFVVNTTQDVVTTTVTPASFTIGPVYDSPTGGSLIDTSNPIEESLIYVQIDSGGVAVADFDDSDIFVSNGCRGTLTEQSGSMIPENTRWRLFVNMEPDTKGYVGIAIPAGVVSVGNEAVSRSYEYDLRSPVDTRIPPRAIFNVPITLQRLMTDIQVSFGERVIGLTSSDFQMTGYTPAPSGSQIQLLAEDFEVQLSSTVSSAPSLSTTGTGVPSISSIRRSPNAPTTGATRLWLISLSSAHTQLSRSNISGATLSRSPSFIDDNYILRITNPRNASGTLNAILQNDSVRSVDDDVSGPTLQQSSGSYGFENAPQKPSFLIDDAYDGQEGTDALSEPITIAVPWIEISVSPADATVTGLTANDIIVSGACAGVLEFTGTAANKKWRMQVNVPQDASGDLTLTIPQNAIEEGNDPISKTFAFDRSGVPYLVITNADELERTHTGANAVLKIEARVDGHRVDISDLTADDFEITSAADQDIDPVITPDPN